MFGASYFFISENVLSCACPFTSVFSLLQVNMVIGILVFNKLVSKDGITDMKLKERAGYASSYIHQSSKAYRLSSQASVSLPTKTAHRKNGLVTDQVKG